MNKELEEFAERIATFEENVEEWAKDGITKDCLQMDYNRCKEVNDDLHLCELKLLWYLRHRKGRNETYLDTVIVLLRLYKQEYEEWTAWRQVQNQTTERQTIAEG